MGMVRQFACGAVLAGLLGLGSASAQVVLTSGLEGPTGSAIGPDGALYVAESHAGRISRVDPSTGATEPFWEGLPSTLPGLPLGGVMDVAFLDGIAYAVVTMVGPDLGGSDIVGIYRMDGPSAHTVIADIGAFNIDNPSPSDVFIPSGVLYAMDTYRGGLLVTDGHHNRVLWASLDGGVLEVRQFENIVPTGLEVHGSTVYVAQLGPAPNLPEDGKVVAFRPRSDGAWDVGSGAPMLVDVEYGLGRALYALAQGEWDEVFHGSPALPFTGSLVRVNADGSFTEVVGGLNQPSSMEFIGNDAYIVSLAGDIWVVEDAGSPPFGR